MAEFGSLAPGGEDEESQIRNFFESVIRSATTDLIGKAPPENVQRFREDYPVAGFGSELLGAGASFLVPFTAPAKVVSRALPVAGRLLKSGESAARITEAPYAAAFERQLGTLLPFEAARVGLAAGFGDEPDAVASTLTQAGFDLALFGGVGVAAEAFRKSRPANRLVQDTLTKLQKRFPEDVDLNAAPQFQARALDRIRSNVDPATIGTDTILSDLATAEAKLRASVFGELQPPGAPYVREVPTTRRTLAQFGEPTRATGELDALFQPGDNTRLFTSSSKTGFSTPARLNAALDEVAAAFPDEAITAESLHRYMQFPRMLVAKSPEEQLALRRRLQKTFGAPVGDGLHMTHEFNEGLYVMAKRITPDKYVVFKTDMPELFATQGARIDATRITQLSFVPLENAARRAAMESVEAGKMFYPMVDQILSASAVGARGQGKVAQFVSGLAKDTRLEPFARDVANSTLNLGRFIGKFVRSGLTQFSRSQRAQAVVSVSRYGYALGDARAVEVLHGQVEATRHGTSLISTIANPKAIKRKGGLIDAVEKLTETEQLDLVEIAVSRIGRNEAIAKGLSPKAIDVAEAMGKWNKSWAEDVDKLQGLSEGRARVAFQAMDDHIGLSHLWRGDFRVPVLDGSNKLVAMGSGHTKAAAIAQADAIVTALTNNGVLAKRGAYKGKDFFLASDTKHGDIALQNMLAKESAGYKIYQQEQAKAISDARQRYFEKTSKGIRGFVGDTDLTPPFTKAELLKAISNSVFARERLRSELLIKSHSGIQKNFSKLWEEDPELAKQLTARLDEMVGAKSTGAKLVDRFFDKPLAPFLGGNAASRIVGVTNKALFNWTLGMGDIGFPLLNALSVVQTALPEVAFALRAPLARLAHFYASAPLLATDGRLVGSMGVLDPLKVMRQGFKEMRHPDVLTEEHFFRAMREGTIGPKYAEEFVGEKAELVKRLGDAFAGKAGFIKGAEALSEFLPAKSEEFVRGWAFNMGRIVARDFYKASDEAIYQFAREFTERTMFLYKVSDRPRIMGGAVGSTLGLFKNWTAHYMANFMTYANEAVTYGNWKPLLWQQVGTWSLAGVGGLPAFGTVDSISEFFSDKTMTENMFNWFGYRDQAQATFGEAGAPVIMDGLFYGIPGFFGLSMQSRATVPGADVGRDVSTLFSFILLDRAIATKDAFGTAIDHYAATGEHPLSDAHTRLQFARAFGPRTLYRLMSVAEEGVLRSSKTGNMIMDGLSKMERVGQYLGIPPTDIARNQEAADILWRRQGLMKERVQQLGQAWAGAEREGNYDALRLIASRAATEGILDSVIKSAQMRVAKMDEPLLERQFDDVSAAFTKNALAFRR